MGSSFSDLEGIAGFLGACLVDSESGLMLAKRGGGPISLSAAAALSMQAIAAKLRVVETLGFSKMIEEILVTVPNQIHLMRPLRKAPDVILYVCLDRRAARLGLARVQMEAVERSLVS